MHHREIYVAPAVQDFAERAARALGAYTVIFGRAHGACPPSWLVMTISGPEIPEGSGPLTISSRSTPDGPIVGFVGVGQREPDVWQPLPSKYFRSGGVLVPYYDRVGASR